LYVLQLLAKVPNAPVHAGCLTTSMFRLMQYLGCKSEEQRRRERLEGQIVAEAKLRHLKVRSGLQSLATSRIRDVSIFTLR
jgi:hypothetical protein